MFSAWAYAPSLILFAVHVAVCVTLVTATGALALWLARRRSAPLRHTLALTGLAVTFIVPAVVAMYHWRLIPQRPLETTSPIVVPQVSRADLAAGPAPLEEAESAASARPRSYLAFYLMSLFVAVWTLGSGVKFGRLLFALARQRTLLTALTDVKDEGVIASAEQLRQRLGIRRQVRLMSMPHAPWPFTVGVIGPRVILPESLLSPAVPKTQLESVLTHELAHVARFDYVTVLVAAVCEAVFWWNPFVRFAKRELAIACEEVCDNYALNYTGDGEPLAAYLLESVEQSAHASLAWGVGMSTDEPGTVARRIKHLLMGEKNSMIRISSLAACALFVTALVIALALTHGNYAHAQLQFGPVVNLGSGVNTIYGDGPTEISPDGLTLYFRTDRPPNSNVKSYRAERASASIAWSSVTPLAELNTLTTNWGIRSVSADQLTALFCRDADDGVAQVLELKRGTKSSPWSSETILPSPVNVPGYFSGNPASYPDRSRIIFHSNRPGGVGQDDLWEASRTQNGDSWTVTNMGPVVNSTAHETSPYVSRDGLLLFFQSNRSGGYGDMDIWMSERTSLAEPWGTPVNLGPSINNPANQALPVFWSEGGILFFRSNGHGGLGHNDIVSAIVIPEPSTFMLFVSCGLLLGTCVLIRVPKRALATRTPAADA